ncbi:MAG: hypothetical protein FJY54_19125 [Betaproteobacteria bacterium]|nr:hypothetical protein [Betaproteobacteria bacterium]
MRLDVGSIFVKGVRFGSRTRIHDQVLTIDRAELVSPLPIAARGAT